MMLHPLAVAGFVAAEGCFSRPESGGRFTFSVALAAADGEMCRQLHRYFGVGHVYGYPRRRAHYDDEVIYKVQALSDNLDVIVPFMDVHLPPCFRRTQFEAWRAHLVDYWDRRAKRRRPCTVDSCDEPQRAKALCRRHYYVMYGA